MSLLSSVLSSLNHAGLCFKYGFWSTCECTVTVCIVSVFSLSWVSLSYTLATSRCLGGLAFVLCIRLANNLGENQKKKMTLFLQPPPLESSRLASKIWIDTLIFGAAAADLAVLWGTPSS